jgi:hypothetical protein
MFSILMFKSFILIKNLNHRDFYYVSKFLSIFDNLSFWACKIILLNILSLIHFKFQKVSMFNFPLFLMLFCFMSFGACNMSSTQLPAYHLYPFSSPSLSSYSSLLSLPSSSTSFFFLFYINKYCYDTSNSRKENFNLSKEQEENNLSDNFLVLVNDGVVHAVTASGEVRWSKPLVPQLSSDDSKTQTTKGKQINRELFVENDTTMYNRRNSSKYV